MARLVFETGKQKEFLEKVMGVIGINSEKLGVLMGFTQKTAQRWLSERTLGKEVVIKRLSRMTGVPLPNIVDTRPEYWGSKLCNNPPVKRIVFKRPTGSLEGRRKGGKVSQLHRKENPEYYRKIGCNVGYNFIIPNPLTIQMAEFIGLVLGDGCISYDQIEITLNSIKDAEYSQYVLNLIFGIFGYHAYFHKCKDQNAVKIIITGITLIEGLLALGMKRGDKVRQQVGVPSCIVNNLELSRWCLRGLMDTDGGIHKHNYKVNRKEYSYLKTCFTNFSKPLRAFVFDTLSYYDFHPKYRTNNKVWLYSEIETKRYLQVIGSSNHRLISQVQ